MIDPLGNPRLWPAPGPARPGTPSTTAARPTPTPPTDVVESRAERLAAAYVFESDGARSRNFRDVGVSTAQARTIDGRRFKPDMLFRMNAPVEGDYAALSGRLIALEIDLRSVRQVMGERLERGSPSWRRRSIPYVNYPIGPDRAYEADDEARDRAVGNVFAALARTRGPVVLHCAAGIDRTGVTTAFLMLALGFTREDAAAEYLRSNRSDLNLPRTKADIDYAIDGVIQRWGSFNAYLAHLHELVPAFDPATTVAALRESLLI